MSTLPGDASRPLFALLLLFSASLALSKSAANVLMTLIYLLLVVQATRDPAFRTGLRENAMQPLVMPLLVYAGVAAIGVTYTEHLADGLGILNKVAGLLFVYFMTALVIDCAGGREQRDRRSEDLLLLFITGVLVLDVIALLTYLGFIGHRKFTLPVYPLHVHHIWFANLNALGSYAALSFLLAGPSRSRGWRRALPYALLPLAAFAILFSTSRTAWLGMLATGVVIAYLLSPRKRRFFAALGIVAGCCVLAYLFVPLVRGRIDEGIADIVLYMQGSRETSMGWRFLMWKASRAMFLENPVFGVGTGDYVITMERFIGSGAYPESLLQFNQPHNMYLFALATNGILGLGALLFLFFSTLKTALPIKPVSAGLRWHSLLAVCAAVHYLVAGLTDSLFNIFILRYSFAFLMGLTIRRSLLFPSPDR